MIKIKNEIKYALSHIGRNGKRILTVPVVGNMFMDDIDSINSRLRSYQKSDSEIVSEEYGPKAVGTFEVQEVTFDETGTIISWQKV